VQLLPEVEKELATQMRDAILKSAGIDARELRDQLASRGMNVKQMLASLSKMERENAGMSEESREFFNAFRGVLEESLAKEAKRGDDGSGMGGRKGWSGGR
jgi:hypothetical protein